MRLSPVVLASLRMRMAFIIDDLLTTQSHYHRHQHQSRRHDFLSLLWHALSTNACSFHAFRDLQKGIASRTR